MGKCEHGLTSKECYVCASPKHGKAPQGGADALRLADAMTAQVEVGGGDLTELEEAAAELRRLHAENERLTTLLADVGQVEAELAEKSDEVHRLRVLNAELLEALKRIKQTGVFVGAIAQEMMDAAIAKAEGEKV